jgi:hypothetical protein
MTQVGGSAIGSLAYETTPFQVFNNRAATDGFMLRWWLNDNSVTSSSGGFGGSSGASSGLTETTTGVASNSDVCICFLNAWAGEGGDRSELRSAEQDESVALFRAIFYHTDLSQASPHSCGQLQQYSFLINTVDTPAPIDPDIKANCSPRLAQDC